MSAWQKWGFMSEKNIYTEEIIRDKYRVIAIHLNEKSRRIWAATEAKAIGRGGIALVSRATGISFKTIKKGIHEFPAAASGSDRIRAKGGGRKKITATQINLEADLCSLIECTTRGDPESPLLWTCKSTYNLCHALTDMGHRISQKTVYT